MGSKNIIVKEDYETAIAEEQLSFIFSILQQSGITESELEKCISEDGNFSAQNKIHLRKLCDQYNLKIKSTINGNIQILLNNKDLLAEWYPPENILHIEDKKFFEIKFNWFSIFESKAKK